MKKLFIVVIAAVSMMTMTSCSKSPSAKAEEFCEKIFEAAKEGDSEKIAEIQDEVSNYEKNLTSDQRDEFMEAERKWEEEHSEQIKEAKKKVLEVKHKNRY